MVYSCFTHIGRIIAIAVEWLEITSLSRLRQSANSFVGKNVKTICHLWGMVRWQVIFLEDGPVSAQTLDGQW